MTEEELRDMIDDEANEGRALPDRNDKRQQFAEAYGATGDQLRELVKGEVKALILSDETTCDKHKAEYFKSGYDAGYRQAVEDARTGREEPGIAWPDRPEPQVIGPADPLEPWPNQPSAADPPLELIPIDDYPEGRIIGQDPEKRKLIGPPHAHLDGPCSEACYEPVNPDLGGVVHAHGEHSMHRHSDADYATHQQPIEGERFLADDKGPVGTKWPQAE